MRSKWRERGSCEEKKGHCSAPSTKPSVATEQATKGHEGEPVQRYGRATLHLLWGSAGAKEDGDGEAGCAAQVAA